MKVVFKDISITKLITALPNNIKSIDDDLESVYKNDIKMLNRIKKVIGLQNRAIAKSHQSALDLAYSASEALLKGYDKNKIKAVIFVTQTPNYFVPNNASILQGKLGLSCECICFDINQACSGFVYGLFNAFSMIEKIDGAVLLVCGDTISKLIKPNDSTLCSMMGDGVSVGVIERVEVGDSFFSFSTQGADFYKLVAPMTAFKRDYGDFQDAGDLDLIKDNDGFLYMNGAEIFNFAIAYVPGSILKLIDFSKSDISKIDHFIFHQANKYIVDNIVKRLELDKHKCPNTTTTKFGNLSAASIPATICDMLESNIHRDFQLCLCSFGAGLSIANALIRISKDNFFNGQIIFI